MKLKDLQLAAMEYPCSAGGMYEGHHVETMPSDCTPSAGGALRVYCTKCRKHVWVSVADLVYGDV